MKTGCTDKRDKEISIGEKRGRDKRINGIDQACPTRRSRDDFWFISWAHKEIIHEKHINSLVI
jgi:hypothetical protein